MRSRLLLLALLATWAAYGQTPKLKWAKNYSSIDGAENTAKGVAADLSGNVFTTGLLNDETNFNTSGSYPLGSEGGYDVYISKMSPSGNLVWATTISGTENQDVNSIYVDQGGNVIVAGTFYGTTHFDQTSSAGDLTASGTEPDLFVASYDNDGNFQWVRQFGNSSVESITAAAPSLAGDIYLSGSFYGTVDFDPGTGVSNLVADPTISDLFIVKLNNNGDFVWAKSIGDPTNEDYVTKLIVDYGGNVVIGGPLFTTVDFDPGSGTQNLTGDNDAYILKLSSAGNFVWVKALESASNVDVGAMALGSSNSILVSGTFVDDTDFDTGSSTLILSTPGQDIYILKLDASGDTQWARQIGGSDYQYPYAATVNTADEIFVSGYFYGTVDFDPGSGTNNITSSATETAFVIKLSDTGTFSWVNTMGNDLASTYPYALSSDDSGSIYVAGEFGSTNNFATNGCVLNITPSNGPHNSFIQVIGTTVESCILITQQPVSVAVCVGDVATFTVQATNGTSITYQWEKFNTATSLYEDVVDGGGYSGATTNVLSVNTTGSFGAGTYRARVEATYSADAYSNSVVLTLGIAAPTTTGSFRCTAGTSNLTAAGASDGSYRWYTVSSGGTAIAGEVNSIYTTPVLSVTTTYYVAIAGGSCESARTAVNAVYNIVSPPVGSDAQGCKAGPFTLTVTGGTNGFYRWYSAPTGGTAIAGATNGTYTTPSISANTTYYVSRINSGCESVRTPINITFVPCNPLPAMEAAYSLGSPGVERLNRLRKDAVGNIYMAGAYNGSFDADPGPGTTSLTGTANFFIKNDPSGNFLWAKSIPGEVLDMGVDNGGNVYITGYFSGTQDFDPGAGIANLISVSGTSQQDVFILKLDGSGNFVWAKSVGGTGQDRGYAIIVNQSNGDVTIGGEFRSTVDFDPGAGTFNQTAPGTFEDIFFLRLDASGAFVWAERIGNTASDNLYDMQYDGAGNIIATGRYGSSNVDFDPGSGTTILPYLSNFDGYVLKLDGNGAFVWAKGFGNNQESTGLSVTTDNSNNVVVGGFYEGTVDFDPGAGVANLTSIGGGQDGFVWKLDASGNFVWARSIGGSFDFETIEGVATDASGKVYATGQYYLDVDLDPGPASYSLTSTNAEVYVVSLDAAGNFVWGVASENGVGGPVAKEILVDASGKVISAGTFSSNSDFDPGSCAYLVSSTGSIDTYVWKLNPSATSICIDTQPLSATACDGSSRNFTVVASGSAGLNYQWQKLNTTTSVYTDLTNSGGFSNVTTSTMTVAVTGNAGTYRVKVSAATAADRYSNSFTITTSAAPGPPTTVGATGCSPASYALTASGASNGLYRWYTDLVSAEINGEVASTFNTPVISTTTTYYAAITDGTCFSTRIPATVTITSGITAPGTTGASSCAATASLVLNASGGTNGQYRWYTVATGGTALPGETNSSYTTPVLSATTTYYVSINNGSCESPRTSVTAVVNAGSSSPSVTDGTRCGTGTVTLAASGGTAGQFRWYTVATGGTAIAGETNGAYTTPSITATTVYYVSVDAGGCESARTSVTATVNPLPAAPGATGTTLCGSGTTTLNATGGTAGQYRWYTVATGGTPIAGETNGSYLTPNLTTTTTYYVSIDNGTCESLRTSVIATVNFIPGAPVTTGATGCTNSSVTLNATGGSAGNYRWYTVPTGGTVLAGQVNPGFVTPVLASTTTYYVSVVNGTCEGPRSPVTATINNCSNNTPPTVAPTTIETATAGTAVLNLPAIITDPDNNIDLSSIKIVKQPGSGAIASLDTKGNLSVDYNGITFVGTDEVVIEVCDFSGSCIQQTIKIEVSGEVIIYNAVSANGDDKNAILRMQYIDVIPDAIENKVIIYNRWGDVVFEVENYNNTSNVFNGNSSKGNPLPSGNYFYKVVYRSGRPTQSGYLTLKR